MPGGQSASSAVAPEGVPRRRGVEQPIGNDDDKDDSSNDDKADDDNDEDDDDLAMKAALENEQRTFQQRWVKLA